MSEYAEVVVLVEGPTEQNFVQEVLGKYLAERGVFLTAIILSKPGEKGGDVKFARAKNDIGNHLKQRKDTYLTLMVDYFGIKSDWPGYQESKKQLSHTEKARIMNEATANAVGDLFPEYRPAERFIPYVSMHEIEALYFSEPAIVASRLGVEIGKVEAILNECREPENINDRIETKPSRRLKELSSSFKKIATGIGIAKEVGIPRMRVACPLFSAWVADLERLGKTR